MSEIQQFLQYLQHEKRYSEHTVNGYETDLKQFIAFMSASFETDKWVQASPMHLRSWFASLKEQGIQSRTIHRKRSSLSTFYKYARRKEWIEKDPVQKTSVPKMAKRLPMFVDQQGMNKLFEEVLPQDGSYLAERDVILVTLLYECGIRLSELIELKWHDVDFNRSQLKVLGKRNKERILPLTEETVERLKGFMILSEAQEHAESKSFVLLTDRGAKLHPKFVYRKVNHYLGEVSTLEKRSPHILRHTFATHMLNNGAQLNSVKELLGHANLSATQVYTHNSIDQLKKIHERNHPKG